MLDGRLNPLLGSPVERLYERRTSASRGGGDLGAVTWEHRCGGDRVYDGGGQQRGNWQPTSVVVYQRAACSQTTSPLVPPGQCLTNASDDAGLNRR